MATKDSYHLDKVRLCKILVEAGSEVICCIRLRGYATLSTTTAKNNLTQTLLDIYCRHSKA